MSPFGAGRQPRWLRPSGRLVAAALLVVQPPLAAATITVNGSPCSLVAAINAANSDLAIGGCSAGSGADRLELEVDVLVSTVNNVNDGSNGLPAVTSEIEIDGQGHRIGRTASAPAFRLFHVSLGGDLTLSNVTVSGGYAKSDGTAFSDSGGAILNWGAVDLQGVKLHTNKANFTGGAVESPQGGQLTAAASRWLDNESGHRGGAIHVGLGSTASLIDSILEDNVSGSWGGGVFAGSLTTVLLSNSTVSGNSGERGGGLYCGSCTKMEIRSSTISGNVVSDDGGGVYSDGSLLIIEDSTIYDNIAVYDGGGVAMDGVAHLINTTVSGNSAGGNGGGILNGGVGTLTNTTVTGNSAAGYGGGLYQDCCDQITVTGSIVAGNLLGGNCYESHPAWPIIDNGANFAEVNTCVSGFLAITPGTHFDRVIADRGGPTMTHALLAGSPAIDAAGACSTPTDQRGAARVGNCDSGAFEHVPCDHVVVASLSVDTAESREACGILIAGPALIVTGTGALDLKAGAEVRFRNGTEVSNGGRVIVTIDTDLQRGPSP